MTNVRTALRVSILSLALASAGCKHEPDYKRGVTTMSVKPTVFLRATPDSDASSLIGMWLPDEIADEDLDESSAQRTRCSDFIKLRKIPGGGDVEEVVTASTGASAQLGVKSIAHLSADRTTGDALRIKYNGIEKLVAQVDTKGLDDCCRINPNQCTRRYISTVVMGDGQVYAATETNDNFGADGQGSMQGVPVDGSVMYKDGYKWERKVTFQHQYFAFQVQRNGFTGEANTGTGQTRSNSCEWANHVPESLDGEYFVGTSPQAPSEDVARDYAMRSAREQVVKYLGEWITSGENSIRTTSGDTAALTSSLDDKKVMESMAQGVARMVKDREWCPAQQIETPKGNMQVVKVLAFFPHSERNAAAKAALTNLIAAKKSAGSLTPEQEKSLQAMIDGIK